MQGRIIIHLDMDCFFAQVEERESPQFKGKPVVVGADPKEGKGRGVVSTANYIARKYGAHSGMPISQAWKLCPEAVFLPANGELYARVSVRIMEIINEVVQSYSPNHRTILIEQTSLDEAYSDVSFIKTYSAAKKIAEDMRRKILKQEQLECSCGVGPNKMIAKMACEAAKPNGIKVIEGSEAEAYIEDLDIQKIPGIGRKTARMLRSQNLEKVADLKKLSSQDMENLFGSRGGVMGKRIRGVDEDSVAADRKIKSIGKEITFEQDTRDPETLIQTLDQIVKQVAERVEEEDLYVKTVTVVCRFSGFETHTKSKTLLKASRDRVVLRREAMKLFLRFVSETQKAIRLVGVRAVIDETVFV